MTPIDELVLRADLAGAELLLAVTFPGTVEAVVAAAQVAAIKTELEFRRLLQRISGRQS